MIRCFTVLTRVCFLYLLIMSCTITCNTEILWKQTGFFLWDKMDGEWRGAGVPSVLDSPGRDWCGQSGSGGSSIGWARPVRRAACRIPSTILSPGTPAGREPQRSDISEGFFIKPSTKDIFNISRIPASKRLIRSAIDYISTGQADEGYPAIIKAALPTYTYCAYAVQGDCPLTISPPPTYALTLTT